MATVSRKKLSKKQVKQVSEELQSLQRQRVWHLKSRNMVANRLQATVAGTIGYHSGMSEKERMKSFKDADKLIKDIVEGKVASDIHGIVTTTMPAINGFNRMKDEIEKDMRKRAETLPIASWVEHPDQRGFGLLFLAIIIGETGDLVNYANPAKVWRRLACAPFTKDGMTLMGATWRGRNKLKKDTKLHASDWEEFGYSPRRRSISFLIGESIVKQNQEGPYRQRYDEVKAGYEEKHPDRVECNTCKGKGTNKSGGTCSSCKGKGKVFLRCHRHSMLLAAKLLLKNLWIEWNDHPAKVVL